MFQKQDRSIHTENETGKTKFTIYIVHLADRIHNKEPAYRSGRRVQ